MPAIRTITSVLLILVASLAAAEDWPGWRGPRGDGSSLDPAPRHWNGATGENVRWKVPVPGVGHSSPVVFGDRVYLATCLPDDEQRVLMCLDRASGRTLWTTPIVKSPLESKHQLNSYASSTPATDGKHIFVSFLEVDGRLVDAPNVGAQRKITPGTMVVACVDNTGKVKWTVRPGGFVSAHGYCSNPVLFENLVIVNGDHDGDSYVIALERETGREVWRTPRKHRTRSYVTPLIREIDGRNQMVLSGSKRVVSMDPRTGKLLWLIEGPTEQYVASMVYDGEKFYMAAGFPTHHVMGIKPTGEGDVTDTHVAWHSKDVNCYVPSPVVLDNWLLVANDRGTANCFDTQTGERLWHERLGKHYSASLVTSGGLAYFTADDGVTKLVKPGPKLDVVAENPLGEYTYASPALSNGQLFIRGEHHLFCIEEGRQ
ncbi:MAG: PQQ-binding-like beta-propeller repeat protein [Planctomycetales bacterium]|nr:PQQ-binding-like beta-propeller repeat protein [Planctomycetales bacterium]